MNALRGEWTKLRTVPRWVMTFVAAIVLTVGLSALGAAGSGTDANVHRNFVVGPDDDPVSDEFGFVHQPVTGDTTITALVSDLAEPTGERPPSGPGGGPGTPVEPTAWTDKTAGVAMKDGTESGSSYVSLVLTLHSGVRMQSDFAEDVAGSSSTGPRWLRLVRTGSSVTGYESADGETWQKVATMTPELPDTAEVGLMVSAAPQLYVQRGMGSSSLGAQGATAFATFDDVTLDPPTDGTWQGTQVTMPLEGPDEGNGRITPPPVLEENDGTFQVTGSGKVGPQAPDDDVVEAALIGVIAGLMALIAVGGLFGTSEYRRSMIRTTFIAEPRRGRVLAAKAVVLGGAAFVVSLVSVVGSFLVAVPILQGNGMAPPAFPDPSLTDWTVVRTLGLTAVFMTGVTLFALAVGMLLRRSAAAITLTIALVMLPLIAGMVLPGTSPRWLLSTTLAGGMAVLRSKPVTESLAEPWALIGPAAGITVVLVYAVGGLALAWWRLRRRDA